MSRPQHEPDLDAEQEVDLRSAWSRIAARWWLPALGIVLGAIVGYALALGGGQVYRAETLVYLGQPFTPQGGGVIPNSIATNPRIVGEIVRSEAALKAASRASGIRVPKLRGSISTQPIIAAGQGRTGTTTLYEIAVTADAPRKAERAANALSSRVSGTAGEYVDAKVKTLEEQIGTDEDEIDGINNRFDIAAREQAAALANKTLPVAERFLIVTSLNSTLSALEQRRSTIQEDLLNARQLLTLATMVEQSRVIEPAVAAKTTARSTRNAALVGALIGLLLGCAAALTADPFLARRSPLRR
ncbi:MAG: hypothetical protein H0V45_10610 [Actinobacteria bacterium]|nr:hypothetical protein [Actinomycetota bacterium]